MPRTPYAALLTAALFSTACLDTSGSQVVTLTFDFSDPALGLGDGWTVGAADVPADRVSEVDLIGGYGGLPDPFATFSGIRESGTSIEGSLFVFHKKWVQSPWGPGTQFRVLVDMAIVTSQHAECTTGPGPNVIIKAGAASEEPVVTTDGQGILRFSLDKGTGASGGRFVQLGDIRNPLGGCPEEGTWGARGTIRANQVETLTVDALGGFWIYFGTQSSYNGRHDIYFTQIRLGLDQQ